jgi:hypothetical protein
MVKCHWGDVGTNINIAKRMTSSKRIVGDLNMVKGKLKGVVYSIKIKKNEQCYIFSGDKSNKMFNMMFKHDVEHNL